MTDHGPKSAVDPDGLACEIVGRTLAVERPVSMDDSMGTLPGWDSLAHMNIVLAIEKEIGRQLTAEEIVSVVSLSDIAVLLAKAKEG